MTELLPCPFCGAPAREIPAHSGELQRRHPAFDTECSNDSCEVQPIAKSTEAWNTRALSQRPDTAGWQPIEETLFKACQELGPWMCAAMDDGEPCAEFRKAASDFVEALHVEVERRITARLSAAPIPQAGWLPIESAPRDGRAVLVVEDDSVYFCWWRDGSWEDNERAIPPKPNHWMPLPAAPQPPKEAI